MFKPSKKRTGFGHTFAVWLRFTARCRRRSLGHTQAHSTRKSHTHFHIDVFICSGDNSSTRIKNLNHSHLISNIDHGYMMMKRSHNNSKLITDGQSFLLYLSVACVCACALVCECVNPKKINRIILTIALCIICLTTNKFHHIRSSYNDQIIIYLLWRWQNMKSTLPQKWVEGRPSNHIEINNNK